MNNLTLDKIKPGNRAKIIGFTNPHLAYRQKFLAMGLTPRIIVEVLRLAPLGDPIQIAVRGFHLGLRKTEAKSIIVELIK